MNYDQVLNLIKVIEDSKFNTFEISFEDTYMNLSKLDSEVRVATPATNNVVTSNVSEVLETVSKETEVVAPKVAEPKKEEVSGVTVSSPIVGTFYSCASSDKPPYVKVGDTIKEGDVLCIVEAMKVMNEVKSKYNGKIVKILANNEDVVEYNQPLFVIEQ